MHTIQTPTPSDKAQADLHSVFLNYCLYDREFAKAWPPQLGIQGWTAFLKESGVSTSTAKPGAENTTGEAALELFSRLAEGQGGCDEPGGSAQPSTDALAQQGAEPSPATASASVVPPLPSAEPARLGFQLFCVALVRLARLLSEARQPPQPVAAASLTVSHRWRARLMCTLFYLRFGKTSVRSFLIPRLPILPPFIHLPGADQAGADPDPCQSGPVGLQDAGNADKNRQGEARRCREGAANSKSRQTVNQVYVSAVPGHSNIEKCSCTKRCHPALQDTVTSGTRGFYSLRN